MFLDACFLTRMLITKNIPLGVASTRQKCETAVLFLLLRPSLSISFSAVLCVRCSAARRAALGIRKKTFDLFKILSYNLLNSSLLRAFDCRPARLPTATHTRVRQGHEKSAIFSNFVFAKTALQEEQDLAAK